MSIKEEDKDKYYTYLEKLRQLGETNMFGARPYLQGRFGLTKTEAEDILCYWMENYKELAKRLGWKD